MTPALAIALGVGAVLVLAGAGVGLTGENTERKADVGTWLLLAGAAILIGTALVGLTA